MHLNFVAVATFVITVMWSDINLKPKIYYSLLKRTKLHEGSLWILIKAKTSGGRRCHCERLS
jgi:hypothetical protein